MRDHLAADITKAASQQTYYTIRLLADRPLVGDAYRAYGYFRWVDDVLDAEAGSEPERKIFLRRQQSLLDGGYRGEFAPDAIPQESLLLEMIRRDREPDSGLQSYLRHMMRVMEFDALRRGRRVSQAELNDYTRWLSIAVADAMRHFIGHGEYTPRDESRYLAVSGAHIIHMLRDTFDDIHTGYYNVPREVLEARSIGPEDVTTDAYRDWVRGRVKLAGEYFEAGREYFRQVRNLRHRLAGVTYMSRFECQMATIEREGYLLRPSYDERRNAGTAMRMAWCAFSSLVRLSWPTGASPAAYHQGGRA